MYKGVNCYVSSMSYTEVNCIFFFMLYQKVHHNIYSVLFSFLYFSIKFQTVYNNFLNIRIYDNRGTTVARILVTFQGSRYVLLGIYVYVE